MATRLRQGLRDVNTLARLGGDEFVIVLEDLPDAEAAAMVAEQIIRQLHQPFPLSDGVLTHIGGSVGISLFPQDGDEAARLIKLTDQALYTAKEAGRSNFKFFQSAIG